MSSEHNLRPMALLCKSYLIWVPISIGNQPLVNRCCFRFASKNNAYLPNSFLNYRASYLGMSG